MTTLPRFVLLAVGFGALASMIGCSADTADRQPEAQEEEEEDTNSEGLAVEGGGGGLPTYTYTTTEDIIPPQVCSGSLPRKDLQKRASAVFNYLIGAGASPTSLYPCTDGSLNYTKLNAIKAALGRGDESAKVKNCFFTSTNNCDTSIKSSRHLLQYVGTSTSVVNALKTLGANVEACWNGAGTWIQPRKPNTPIGFEGDQQYNFGENCMYKEAYLKTTETRSLDGTVLSRSYKIGCFRTDPEPAQLYSDLNLQANGNAAWAMNLNTGTWTPLAFTYQNTWKYDPSGPAAGSPCVAPQMMPGLTTWQSGFYVNNYMQVTGSYRRCLTQL